MENVYSPPQANLQNAELQNGKYGSIENALKGNYEVPIIDTISEAWSLVKGSKKAFFLASIIIWGINTVINVGLGYIFESNIVNFSFNITLIIFQYLFMILMAPFFGGVIMMGVHRAVSEDISFTKIFEYFSRIISIVLLLVLCGIFFILGYFLFLLPGIYLAVGYSFSLQLLLDRKMKIRDAMKFSRVAVTKHWFRIFGFLCVIGFILLLSYLPVILASLALSPYFGLGWEWTYSLFGSRLSWFISILGFGLIWTIPLFYIALGIMYRRIFGVSWITE